MSNENLVAAGSSTRSVGKARMFASYMSSARNWVAKSRDRFGSKSLYGNIMTAFPVARKFRRAVRGTYTCASNGTSPLISSKTVEPRATPPPRRASRSRLPEDGHQRLLHLHPRFRGDIVRDSLPGIEDDERILHARQKVVEPGDDLVPDDELGRIELEGREKLHVRLRGQFREEGMLK